MEVRLTFDELAAYVASHYGRDVTFSMVDDRTVCVGVMQKVLFRERQFHIYLTIESATDTEVILTYGASAPLEMAVRVALNYIKRNKPLLVEAVQICAAQRLKVNLAKVPRAVAVVEALAFESIVVKKDGFLAVMSLR